VCGNEGGKAEGFATVGECIRSSSMLNLNMCEVLVVGRYLISKYVLLVIEDFSFLLCGDVLSVLSLTSGKELSGEGHRKRKG